MKNILIQIKLFNWMLVIVFVCLTFTHVVLAETKEHQHSPEQHKSENADEVESHGEHESHDEHDEDEDHEGEKKHGEHEEHEESSRKVGEGKAVVEIHDEKGFRLSSQAYDALGIELQQVNQNVFRISKSTLIRIKNTTGIYRHQDHFFKLIPVRVKKEEKNHYLIKTPLESGDHIVIKGIELLRVADVYAQDTSEYSHGH
ncbi:MAG: hypothetical protein KDK51_00735 [Deltaproteobacteria bacterium]|nr:hypothetical protein [Deltaproteobacteria bacterium]